MHVPDHDHHGGAGMCAKIVFFSLMAILLSLVVLIVIENRGGSDVDTPLSESRFSEYLQGWVDEKREEEHHDPIISNEDHDEHDEHEDHDEIPDIVPENEPYPEEKDVSNPDDNDDNESQELNAEINVNESEQEALSKEDDQDENDESPNSQEENLSQQENDDNNPNIFEDSAPFEEEVKFYFIMLIAFMLFHKTNKMHSSKIAQTTTKGEELKKQVDQLYNTYNEIADMLGKERLDSNKKPRKEAIMKKLTKVISKCNIKDQYNLNIFTYQDDDDDLDENKENVIDNDEGEDLLLQKIAEESENAQQKSQESSGNEPEDNQESSSRKFFLKLIIKKTESKFM